MSTCHFPPQKHLWFDCFVDDPSAYETHLNALIDNACSPVLIRLDFANKLQLQQFTLPEPVKVNLAVDSGKIKKFEFGECIELRLYSIDHSWKSKKIRSVVAPCLCTKLILGLSFLASHSIVIDHKTWTIINKHCGKDLNKDETKPQKKLKPFEEIYQSGGKCIKTGKHF